ncbi:nitroreductase family protein [Actinophytocola algeriensis]|uniref:Nitroreductase n=1 Tax=Actinophytocola algeriensis TaxID=1768010 RepID=A0A7W7VED7_9PSEU|nr:nitroreductase family protein [Actinophytocola algeriensis]MBB4907122.1 nitroreductase [Actinophytocola algeriensis]MBE1478605.1 nitroreductase [Actinophytocola algeriensis]
MTDKDAETSVPIHPLLAARWSPRALDPAGVVTDEQLRAVLEAARWAPSNGNTQPARYLVGRRGDETYARLFDLLSRRNQGWAHPAAMLVLVCAVTVNEKGTIPMPEYGVGLAAENLVLQAVAEGLVAHQMGGFNREGAKLVFSLPADVEPQTVIALGTLGDPALLDEERRAKELAPRRRLALDEIAFTGEWGNPVF